MEDPDEDLLRKVMPIIDWRNEIAKKVLLSFYGRHSKKTEELVDVGKIHQESREIDISGNLIPIHPDFRLVITTVDTCKTKRFSNSFYEKVHEISAEFHDDSTWKQMISDTFVNAYFLKEKKLILDSVTKLFFYISFLLL